VKDNDDEYDNALMIRVCTVARGGNDPQKIKSVTL